MSWLQEMSPKRPGLYAKRAFDIAVSGTGLAVLSPVVAGLVAAECVFHGWPPFFVQARSGMHGRVFKIVKLRTMSDARDAAGELLPDEERLTGFGTFLRSTSLDELPELWNVLKGDMSLVGPRPFVARYLERYDLHQMRRHEMPPGITGWAQVNGRNTVGWADRFELDVWYVDNWSFWLDLRILAATVRTVVRREGINEDGQATVSEFVGASA